MLDAGNCASSAASADSFEDSGTPFTKRSWALGGSISLLAILTMVGMAVVHNFRSSNTSLRQVVELEESSGGHRVRNGSNSKSIDFFDTALSVLDGNDTTRTTTTTFTT
jgi:hypothetical protein